MNDASFPGAKWSRAHEEVLAKEKELTRAHDQLAAERRRAPWMKVEKDHVFEGPAGTARLVDLFDGRRHLIVYPHMLKPADPHPCEGCRMVGDQIPHLAHIRQRDTSLVFVSRAPIDEIEAFEKRMGWTMPWFSTADSFNAHFEVASGFVLNVFYRDGENVYRTDFTNGRGGEASKKPGSGWDNSALPEGEKLNGNVRRCGPVRWASACTTADAAPSLLFRVVGTI